MSIFTKNKAKEKAKRVINDEVLLFIKRTIMPALKIVEFSKKTCDAIFDFALDKEGEMANGKECYRDNIDEELLRSYCDVVSALNLSEDIDFLLSNERLAAL